MGTNSLVIGEEEESVLRHRPANTASELAVVEGIFALSGIFEEIAGVEVLVAVVFVGRTVEFVGAAFAYSDEDGAASLSVFGGHAVLLDAELLDGVQRWRNRCAT